MSPTYVPKELCRRKERVTLAPVSREDRERSLVVQGGGGGTGLSPSQIQTRKKRKGCKEKGAAGEQTRLEGKGGEKSVPPSRGRWRGIAMMKRERIHERHLLVLCQKKSNIEKRSLDFIRASARWKRKRKFLFVPGK